MIFAVDVHYVEDTAFAAGILFSHWETTEIYKSVTKRVNPVAAYQPGAFYKRELPCLLELLSQLEATPTTLLIDGYVTLGEQAKPGLGQHLFDHLLRVTPVIGIAKTKYIGTPANCEILRGKSKNPLYITAAGIPHEEAKRQIIHMHGVGRIPTLLMGVDRLAREMSKNSL